MPQQYNKMAFEILRIFKESGKAGLTLKEVSKRIEEKGCGHDCENWIDTFVEAGILITVKKPGELNRYFLTEKGMKALE